MSQIIVSDATSLIVLEKQQRLALLCDLFEQILVPEKVYHELLLGLHNDQCLSSANCITIVKISSSGRLYNLRILLDEGEADAIELAIRKQLPLIIDEKKGRTIAQSYGLVITGLAGILVLSVRKKVLNSAQALDILDVAMKQGYWLSMKLYEQVTDLLKNS